MPREPKRRKWSVAIEADEDLTDSDIALLLDINPGLDVVNVEEIEESFTEENDDDDVP